MWCTFQKHLSMGKRHFQNMILRLKQFLSLSSFIWHSLCTGVNVSILQNYTSFEDQITRAESQKNTYLFHYDLNLFICCKTKLKIKFLFYRMRLFYRMIFFAEWIFLNRIRFFERGYKYFVWIKITTFFKRHLSIILWSFSS